MNLENKRVLVTGGMGFLGQYIVSMLVESGAYVHAPHHYEYDLRERADVCAMITDFRPEVIVHCAATVGGIGLNKAKPGKLFYDNAVMGINLMEEARAHCVLKYVQLGTICAYPKHTPEPFKEDDLWNGYPEETNAPYGISKRMLIAMADAYRKQYGFNAITLMPVNLYGPGDHFELDRCHVIPAIIHKFDDAIKAGDKSVTLWGTGLATREFLYVKDAAEAIVLATQKYDGNQPVNVGSGHALPIHRLAHIIAYKMGYHGDILFDSAMPDGQPKRRLDVTKARELFGFEAKTSLSDGLDVTIQWYKECEKYL